MEKEKSKELVQKSKQKERRTPNESPSLSKVPRYLMDNPTSSMVPSIFHKNAGDDSHQSQIDLGHPPRLAKSVPALHSRSNLGKLHAYDLEIDRTFHRLIRSHISSESSAFAFDFGVFKSVSGDPDFDFDIANFNSNLGVCISKFSLDNMVENNRTLKELVTLDIMYQPWCIRYPKLEQAQSYEFKYGLIHLLPKFHGLAGVES
ncbi:hypothetical protein CR513_36718, partial [Mucuna pruriens]